MNLITLATSLMMTICLLPEGWRVPDPQDLAPSFGTREENSTPYFEADFNLDGITDRAVILISEEASREGLFVMLSGLDEARWLELSTTRLSAGKVAYELVKVSPRALEKMLPDVLNDLGCGGKVPPGIDYFPSGSHGVIYAWSCEKQEFLVLDQEH